MLPTVLSSFCIESLPPECFVPLRIEGIPSYLYRLSEKDESQMKIELKLDRLPGGYDDQVRARSDQAGLRFQSSRDSQKPFAILRMIPPVLKVRKDPAGPFDPINARDLETGLRNLRAQLVRVMEKGIHEIFQLPGGIPVLTVMQVLINDLGELGIFQVPMAKAIERGSEARYAHGEKDAAWLENAIRFSQRLKTVLSIRQMVQRSEKQDRIDRCGLPGESAGIADAGAGQRRFRLTAGGFLRHLHVQWGNIDQMDLVALSGKPAGMTTRPAADVQNRGRRRRQKPQKKLARARPVQLAFPGMQPVRLIAGGIVIRDFFGLWRLGIPVSCHLFSPLTAFVKNVLRGRAEIFLSFPRPIEAGLIRRRQGSPARRRRTGYRSGPRGCRRWRSGPGRSRGKRERPCDRGACRRSAGSTPLSATR